MHILVSDRVTFTHRGRSYTGYVAKKGRVTAHVICDDRREFRVPYPLLRKIAGAQPQPVQGRADTVRSQFQVDDRVQFPFQRQMIEGAILRCNPKRAHLIGDDGREYQVPYSSLTCIAPTQDHPQRLNAIAAQSRALLAQHQLSQWSFQFDNGTRRAGCCHYDTQVISISAAFARQATEADLRDTVLHEIAHALAGKAHNHDAVWQTKAREIGCSGNRCHSYRFATPRYIVTCEHRCWVATADRRHNRGRICKHCQGKLVYLTYTEERWQQELARQSKKATP